MERTSDEGIPRMISRQSESAAEKDVAPLQMYCGRIRGVDSRARRRRSRATLRKSGVIDLISQIHPATFKHDEATVKTREEIACVIRVSRKKEMLEKGSGMNGVRFLRFEQSRVRTIVTPIG